MRIVINFTFHKSQFSFLLKSPAFDVKDSQFKSLVYYIIVKSHLNRNVRQQKIYHGNFHGFLKIFALDLIKYVYVHKYRL